MHGTAIRGAGCTRQRKLPSGQPGQRFSNMSGLLFGFEGPSLLGSLTDWMLNRVSPALRMPSLSGPIAQLARARA